LTRVIYPYSSIFKEEHQKFFEGLKKSKLIILLICGCQKYKQSLLKSLERFSSPEWETIGIIGGQQETTLVTQNDKKILHLKVEDSYEFLPKKIFLAFQWCFKNFPLCEGVFKTDEDILISNMKKFTKSLLENKKTLYWGVKCSKTAEHLITQERINSRFENTKLERFKVPEAHYCYGAGYWVSEIAWNKICENKSDFSVGLEDVLIGKALNNKQIFPIEIYLPYSEIKRSQ